MFGYPGGAILNIYDALYKHQDEITHILTSHEAGRIPCCGRLCRATGKVGVCLATSGLALPILVTGIATAFMDSIPMVAITCNVGVSLLGRDSFREIDITGVTMPITKYNFIVKDIKSWPIRCAGRLPSPRAEDRVRSLLISPKDVTAAITGL